MWCVPQLDQEYLARMEAVLEVLNRPLDKRAPVVALDERPVQLLDSLRPASVFCVVEAWERSPASEDVHHAGCQVVIHWATLR